MSKLKLNFFGYYFEDEKERFEIDIRPLIKNFVTTDDQYKNNFETQTTEDKLFLLPTAIENCYSFIQTNNSEVIKVVNTTSLQSQDVTEKILKDEKLGFASYLYINKNFIGISSSIKGPKQKAFCVVIQQLLKYVSSKNSNSLESVAIRNLKFIPYSLPKKINQQEARKLQVKHGAIISFGKNSSFFQQVSSYFGAKEPDNLDAIQIELKPVKGTKNGLDGDLLDNLIDRDGADKDVKKFILRGKEEIGDLLTNFYLVGEGFVSSYINKGSEREIIPQIKKETDNKLGLIQDKIKEIKNEQGICETSKYDSQLSVSNSNNNL